MKRWTKEMMESWQYKAGNHMQARRAMLNSWRPKFPERQSNRYLYVDETVWRPMTLTPREKFVPPEHFEDAFKNIAVPIGDGQTISQPQIVYMMTMALLPLENTRILEIGTGSGYQTAVLSRVSRSSNIITVERIPRLATEAQSRLNRLGYRNIQVKGATDHLGWPGQAPYDRIMVTAGAPDIPAPLVDQLAIGGRMILPAGPIGKQELILVRKNDHTANGIKTENLGPCAFVPLIGRDAWPPEFD
jgi:protein-L-isoaspartate(D-aspartate) O-methyltransferase